MILADLIVIMAAILLWRTLRDSQTAPTAALAPRRPSAQLTAAVTYADRLFADKKWLGAEKAYLNVLKLDHNNLTAYSHLGIIYSTQKNHRDAIECFQIAVRLKPTASTHQNLAMAYYENHNYIKSVSAFDKAIMFEPSVSRYVGLSKAYRKISNTDRVIASLEQAYALDAGPRVRELLVTAYHDGGRTNEAKALEQTPDQTPEPTSEPATP